ncbi:MAG: hypothetical protein H6900_09765 [Rhodobacter sp.]|uniref:hypothetical protein n=1 Tax=Pararhodobacter sp. TaxID=2127056 RepID=UPI001D5B697F|nr:hypothetical protein [Pararhodobacter sp.]MCB1345511.1 hypothetical protein [Paracoccaceae bacterium]MCC0073563.1 hypothetical protein [Rhodobacter sp.]HPD92108.1 hypothetical protein [Pararhodobacter sp.]
MQSLIRASVMVVLVSAQAAWATDVQDPVVARLRNEGYSQVEVSRTWLGRTRILASGPQGQREVILSRNSGEVLRDHMLSGPGAAPDGGPAEGEASPGGGPEGGAEGGGGGDGGGDGGGGEHD